MKLFVYVVCANDKIIDTGRVEKRSISSAFRWLAAYMDSHHVLNNFDTVEAYIRESN